MSGIAWAETRCVQESLVDRTQVKANKKSASRDVDLPTADVMVSVVIYFFFLPDWFSSTIA